MKVLRAKEKFRTKQVVMSQVVNSLQKFYKVSIEKLFSKWVIEDEGESVCVCVCILMIQPTMLLRNIISNR